MNIQIYIYIFKYYENYSDEKSTAAYTVYKPMLISDDYHVKTVNYNVNK